jgi:salicylate hydroxylase
MVTVTMAALRVAIIGGGIGGLSAATALLRKGMDVRVYEQAPALAEVGAGVGLYPNSLRLLKRWGFGAGLARYGAPVTDMRFCRSDGSVVTDMTAFISPEEPNIGIHRADLVTMLADALPAGVVRTGYRGTGFSQGDASAVVTFDNGERAEADVVVAADGIHSVLRHHVGPAAGPVFSGSVAYRGTIPADRVPEWPVGAWRAYMGKGKHFLAYPVRAGQLLNFVGFVPADDEMRESWSASGDPTVLAAEFTGWNPVVERILAAVDATFRWGLYDHPPLDRWSRGRLTLLGDAAHPMLPHLGQGVSQSIEDAAALAALLDGVGSADVTGTLARYESLRRDRTARIQGGARSNGALYDASDTDLRGRDEQVRTQTAELAWVYDYDAEAEAHAAR